jgi:flagellar biosynthesis/type III secretory pathway M-ring protein FliF/YscJ
MFRSMNPDMMYLYGNLDEHTFGKVSTSLAQAGVRMKTTPPPGPYTIWVAKPDYQNAMTALHSAGALESAPIGIEVGSGGASSVFMGQAERMQVTQKRRWQEIQVQLEAFNWVAKATCTSSPPVRNAFLKGDAGTVSVILTLFGTSSPDAEQRMMAANTVRNGFGVPAQNVNISDHHGRRIFDGSRDSGLEENLAHEEQFNRTKTDLAQRLLDDTYGPGLAKVSVSGAFSYEKYETLDETVSATKNLLSEESRDTATPVEGGGSGGAVTMGAGGGNLDSTAEPAEPATTSEVNKRYAPARNYKYTKHDQPVLTRLTVSLILDESVAASLLGAQDSIKGVLGFDSKRDEMFAVTQLLHGVERDSDGNPVAAAPIEAPEEPMSGTMLMLIENGVEIVAAIAFIMLLVRALKRGNVNIEINQPGADLENLKDDEIDMDALARRHVEDLLARDPDRVGALLSRWAISDDFYVRTSE